MRAIFTICMFGFYLTASWSQTERDWPLLEELSFIVNPAMASKPSDLTVMVTHAKKWRRLSSSPHQSSVGAIMPFNNDNMSWGAHVFSEAVGPFKTVGTRLAYAYKFRLSHVRTDQLSLGISTRLMHVKLDQEHFVSSDIDDPLVQNIETNGLVPPSFSAGFSYNTGEVDYATPVQFNLSGSMGRVLPFEDRFGSLSLDRSFQWYGSAGIDIAANSEIVIQPSLLYSRIAQRPGNLSVRLRSIHQRFGWIMMQYERAKTFTTQIGIYVGLGSSNEDILQVSFSNGWYVGQINGQLGNSFTFGVMYRRGYRSQMGM